MSISDHAQFWPGEEEEEEEETEADRHSLDKRKESSASFLNPAVNFARRMSMKITGNRGEQEEGQQEEK